MNLDTIKKVKAVEIAIDSLFDDIDCADDEMLTCVERIANKIGVLRSCTAKSWVDSGAWAQDPGLVTPANALAHHINIPRPHAHGLLQSAATLDEFSAVKELACGGVISLDHVRSISSSDEPELSDLLHDNEKFMCEIMPSVDVHQFARVMRRWKDHARALTNSKPTPQLFHGRRSFHLSSMLDGMYKLDATLAPEEGLMLHQFIEKESDCLFHAQERSGVEQKSLPSQLRSDAFAVLIRHSMAEYNDKRAQPLPLITVDVDYTQLCDRAQYNPLEKISESYSAKHSAMNSGMSRASQNEVVITTSDLDTDTLLKLACDAKIVRHITDGPTNILEQGRTTRIVSSSLKHFLRIRDRGCTFPGCDRPGNWCDAHHIIHWAHGGPTNKNNLVLLCSTHHSYVHSHNYDIEITDGSVLFSQRAGP